MIYFYVAAIAGTLTVCVMFGELIRAKREKRLRESRIGHQDANHVWLCLSKATCAILDAEMRLTTMHGDCRLCKAPKGTDCRPGCERADLLSLRRGIENDVEHWFSRWRSARSNR